MAAASINPPNPRKRTRKRRKRRNVSSSSSSSEISDSSSSSSDSENENENEPSTVKIPQKPPAKAVVASKESSSSSESSADSDSDSDSSIPFRKPPAATETQSTLAEPDGETAAPHVPPVSSSTTTQKHTRALSPPPLKNVPEPSILDGDKAHEEALRARFRQFWLGSVADAFADDLNEIRKEPNLTPARLSLLIDSLAAGADIYTSSSNSPKTNSKSNPTSNEKGKAQINEMEVILGESE
ncbi:uncharacterized protein FOMMEDRAFT_171371 [Fomitiporia mediterranea MF3/22]|uniref:uncharacterized protein n=1 Tax=Fomitiporia mediterranea (strain MF3/22) TaxID=694068 RepID=UPI00044084D1|nr:uncharacterized protein FOMMEDRAFT_171371 [Fomitiporia mediterranea MF3/22]EJC97991.1 hypothetical protein FOMMEDRAFT_171371 [Fomitiporia mediterranea MF3/22]